MKKFSWILALIFALSMAFVFAGCGEDEPALAGGKYGVYLGDLTDGILITGRTKDWCTFDVKLNIDSKKKIEVGSKITVKGKIFGTGQKIKIAQPDADYAEIVSKSNQGEEFELTKVIEAGKLDGQTKIRVVQTETSGNNNDVDIFVYFVEITDKDGSKVIFSLTDWFADNSVPMGQLSPTGDYLSPVVFAGDDAGTTLVRKSELIKFD